MSTESLSESCPHELRPGTTVCLHCARADRLARSRRARRKAGQAAVAAITVAGLAGVAVPGLRALQRRPDVAPRPLATAVAPAMPAAADADAAPPADAPAAPAAPAAFAAVPAATSVRALRPRLPEGRTALAGGMVAERHGDTVRVSFDTPRTRTRRAEKFDGIVRATLPALYGAPADSALALVPTGALVPQAELLGAATGRGVRLPLADGRALALRAETRPGQDGPLVVRYVVTLADAGTP
jgi:hypothetical protein